MEINVATRHRSLGLKLILVGALAFFLWIPAMLVYGLVFERSGRADDVKNEIYGLVGGRQTISGPVVIVPATIDTGELNNNGESITVSRYFVFTPRSLAIDASIEAMQRRRSIYDATIYDADIVMTGAFAGLTPPQSRNEIKDIFWDRAVLALKFDNNAALKGVLDTPQLSVDGKVREAVFEPGINLTITGQTGGEHTLSAPGISTFFSITDPQKGFSFQLTLPMSGGGALLFSPAGEETKVSMRANWPDPSFHGEYLPDERSITADGFTATWRIPYLARNLPRSFAAEGSLGNLDAGKAFGVDLIDAASPYQSVNRALKYALMFLGIVFLTFFLFEATTGARAHPAQYILLGLTQVIFYLLVLAFAEHIGFEKAFAGTAAATVILSGTYAATVFHSFWRGILALIAFSGAYGLIYLLMKSEDYALLIGSVTAFSAVALTMYVTRSLNWYGGRDKA
ncbi:cell envelope integrity protein CreD [Hyphococcus sp.]|uniref:cell envelope integrity protein CreD n=1 Tax=Hyphococcus sp. TaxID=2038636 RepID=UPI00208C6C1D|nr:MAG: cell envelope integrity protein CreD [Marinicaulis sp.]